MSTPADTPIPVPVAPPAARESRQRLRLVWVLTLGAIFMALLVGSLLLIRHQAFSEMGDMLERDLEGLAYASERQLDALEDYLRQCQAALDQAPPAAEDTEPPPLTLPDPARQRLPVMLELFWADAQMVPQRNLLPNSTGLIAVPAPLSEPPPLWRLPNGQPKTLFRLLANSGKEPLFEALWPVLEDDAAPVGYIVARLSLSQLVRQSVQGAFFENYALAIWHVSGPRLLANLSSDGNLSPELRKQRQLDARLPEVILVSQVYDLAWRQTIKGMLAITMLLAVILVIAMLSQNREIERRTRAEQEKDRLIAELQQALHDVRSLKKLLPICMYCKKVRDDNDFWQQIEHYFKAEAGTDFSHGVCPQCYKDVVVPILDNARREAEKHPELKAPKRR